MSDSSTGQWQCSAPQPLALQFAVGCRISWKDLSLPQHFQPDIKAGSNFCFQPDIGTLHTPAPNLTLLFKQYVLKAAKKEGGAYFLSQLLDLRDRHCPDLNLNFGSSESSRTPWWYLVYSTNDVDAMIRVLQALREHSIEFKSLLTHTDGENNVIEAAMEKNKALFNKIQRFAEWQQHYTMYLHPMCNYFAHEVLHNRDFWLCWLAWWSTDEQKQLLAVSPRGRYPRSPVKFEKLCIHKTAMHTPWP